MLVSGIAQSCQTLALSRLATSKMLKNEHVSCLQALRRIIMLLNVKMPTNVYAPFD